MSAKNDDFNFVQQLQALWPGKVEALDDRFYPAVRISTPEFLAVMAYAKEELQLDHLSNLSAVDYGTHLDMVYHLHSFASPKKLLLKLQIPDEAQEVPSLCSIYPTADWQEREVFDLLGITFSGHPNLKRILLPLNFAGHPLRKNFKGGDAIADH